MDLLTVLVPALSVVIGALVPGLREIVALLLGRGKSNDFFSTRFGTAILEVLNLQNRRRTPSALFKELAETSAKMDAVVARIREYVDGREEAVAKLEAQLGSLTQQEQELRQRVEELKGIPLGAAEYFASLVSKGERSSAFRDYALFSAGVIVSAGVTVALKHFGIA